MVGGCTLETRVDCVIANAVVVSKTGWAMRGVGGEEELWRERESMDKAEGPLWERGVVEVETRREK